MPRPFLHSYTDVFVRFDYCDYAVPLLVSLSFVGHCQQATNLPISGICCFLGDWDDSRWLFPKILWEERRGLMPEGGRGAAALLLWGGGANPSYRRKKFPLPKNHSVLNASPCQLIIYRFWGNPGQKGRERFTLRRTPPYRKGWEIWTDSYAEIWMSRRSMKEGEERKSKAK